MSEKLTDKQKAFVAEYLVDLNATQAAIRAGYSAKNADKIGSQLLGKTRVAEAINVAKAERARRTQISQDEVIQELKAIALSDPRQLFNEDGQLIHITEWNDDVAAAVSSLEVVRERTGFDEDGKPEFDTVRKIKRWDKLAALDKLAKHLGMFVERMEIGKSGDFTHLSDADLERIAGLGRKGDTEAPAVPQKPDSIH